MSLTIGPRVRDRKNSEDRTDEGFTLIEILTAFVLVAIAIAVGALIFIKLRNNAYDNAAQQELSKIQTAQEEYITSGDGASTNVYANWKSTDTTGASGTTGSLSRDPVDYQGSSGVSTITVKSPSTGSGTTADQTYCASVVSKSGTTFYITQALNAATKTAPTNTNC